MRLIIDGDPIVYAAGFAAEQTTYNVVAEDESGALHQAHFAPVPDPKDKRKSITAGAQMKAWLADNKLVVVDKERVPVAEPVGHALHLVTQQLRGIVASVKRKHKQTTVDMRVLLTGPGNFREVIATIRKYKGNRDPAHKPVHYKAIREFMQSKWNARVIEGHEADDEASIMAHEARRNGERYVVASIDKDLDQIPGWHYNYQRKVHYTVSEEEGQRFFWQQVLSGDGTDNIPGGYRIGPAVADTLLSKAEQEGCSDDACRWMLALDAYEKSQRVAGCPYIMYTPQAVALETARLVYMQQCPRELWTPPGMPKLYLEATIDD